MSEATVPIGSNIVHQPIAQRPLGAAVADTEQNPSISPIAKPNQTTEQTEPSVQQRPKRKQHPTDDQVLESNKRTTTNTPPTVTLAVTPNELLLQLCNGTTSSLPSDIRTQPLHSQFEYIVSKGADINTKDTLGNTPLHTTTFLPRMLLLIKHGANTTIKNKAKQTPAQVHADRFSQNDKLVYRITSEETELDALERRIVTLLLEGPAKSKAARKKQNSTIFGIDASLDGIKIKMGAPSAATEFGRRVLAFDDAVVELKRIHDYVFSF
ncbi:hypothetical protein BCR33DRAFT_848338 [Rhizoclosmatium globosum]|uniref:Uncharacterized protein n=1 Tax=Rhizoclosmatium globosum TaxID=329046 RepID=A0A1Y2CMV6_9FUNG|nr:hypothetical protein BCR33DRAFT_848338 [Rhizoclosmatium globosum]|eukprot:ORY48333.1 hypothetical protein BCR33DRAFT_848338 [Rhizoclosmatium globosum]